jgi:hypothetical protein
LRICPAYCRPTCGTPASELAELDGSNLDRSWIEFGGSDRFSGVALGHALIGADDDALDQFGDFTPAADNSAGADSFPSEVFNLADYLRPTRGSRISTACFPPA